MLHKYVSGIDGQLATFWGGGGGGGGLVEFFVVSFLD